MTHQAVGGGPPRGMLCGESRPLRYDPLAPTIFHQPWWLDAVSPGQWQAVEAREDGRVVGRFPFVIERMLGGYRACGMPALTHFLGPAIDDGPGAACNRILRRAQVTRALLAQVPRTSGFWQKLHRGTPDTLVYQELGFATSVQFTFEVAPADHAALWRAMRDKTRNVIRRAEERLAVADLEPAAFARCYLANLARRATHSHYPAALIERVCTEAMRRGQGRILAAREAAGAEAAAIFYVWDAEAAYYLLSTRRADAHNGAVSLLLWHAMREIAALGLMFDFEGVANPGSALFFAGFGGTVAPRYVVSRHSFGHRLAAKLGKARALPSTRQGHALGTHH